MTNALKIADLLAEKTLYQFKSLNTFLAPGVYNNDCEEYFIYSQNGGYFPGNSVRFRLPNMFDYQRGYSVTFGDVVEEDVTVTMQDPISIPVSFRSDEAVTQINLGNTQAKVWAERISKPISATLMAVLNNIIAQEAETSVYNWVGDASADITTSNVFYDAGSMLSQLDIQVGAPYNGYIALHTRAKQTLYPEVPKLFLPALNENIFKQGLLGSVNSFDTFVEPQLTIHRAYAGTLGTPLIRVNSASGDTTVKLKGLTPSITGIIKAGDLFTVTGAGVNPTPTKLSRLIKANTGLPFQFVVTADADSDASGYTDVSIKPTIISDPTNPRRNISNILHVDDVVNFVGDYTMSLAFVQPALNVVAPPLAKLDQGAISSVIEDKDTRISIRYSAQDNVQTSAHGRRMDVWPAILWIGDASCKIISKAPAL